MRCFSIVKLHGLDISSMISTNIYVTIVSDLHKFFKDTKNRVHYSTHYLRLVTFLIPNMTMVI